MGCGVAGEGVDEEAPGERNVALDEPPGTGMGFGDLSEPAEAPGDLRLGDFSLGSRVLGSDAVPAEAGAGYLVGDMMLSLASSGRFSDDDRESRGEIWRRGPGRSPGEVDNTCWANLRVRRGLGGGRGAGGGATTHLGRGSDIGSELFCVLR